MENTQFYKGVIDAPGCVSNGWNLIKPNYWMYFGIGVLVVLSPLILSCIPCLNILLVGPLSAVLTAGIYYVLLRDMRGEPVEFSMMFKGFENLVPILVVGVIQAIPSMIFQALQWALDLGRLAAQLSRGARGNGNFFQSEEAGIAITAGLIAISIVVAILIIIFSIAWAITFEFAIPLVIEQNLGPIEAIKLSARAGWSNIGGLIVLMLIEGLIVIAGFLAICIGMFFVFPVVFAAKAFAYRQVFPLLNQTFQTVPPPNQHGGFAQGM